MYLLLHFQIIVSTSVIMCLTQFAALSTIYILLF